MTAKNLERNSSIELLRFVAMFGILVIHTFGHGSGLNFDFIYGLGSNWNTAGHLALFSLGETGVTVFMFISGYYGIRLNLKKTILLVIMLSFYVLITGLVEGQSIKGITLMMLHPWDNGWWFVKSYLIVMLLSPFINAGIEKLREKQMRIVVLSLLFYTYFGHFLNGAFDQNTELLLTIYLAARYLKIYPPQFAANGRQLASCQVCA